MSDQNADIDLLFELVSTWSTSGEERAASDVFVRHARERGFEAHVDGVSNAIAHRGPEPEDAAAHIVLLGHDIRQLPVAIKLGRATMRRIVAGLLWASIYNVCLIPLAATGLMHPMYAALAMSLSSVSVVINALWLKWRWKG